MLLYLSCNNRAYLLSLLFLLLKWNSEKRGKNDTAAVCLKLYFPSSYFDEMSFSV